VTLLSANLTGIRTPASLEEDIFTEDLEIRLMGRKREHDQIGVKTVNDMTRVGIVLWVRALSPDPIHDLVLSLSGYRGVGNNDVNLKSAKFQ
jgi:hypothetical protein